MALGQKEVINLVFKGKDEVSKVAGGIKGALGGLGKVAGVALSGLAIGGAAAIGAVTGVSLVVGKLVKDAAAVEGTAQTFASLTKEIGGSEKALEAMQGATRGMVKESDLMAGANQFLAMGITDTIEGTAEMAEMATQLGMAMGTDATTAMSDFAAMMANQSLPRLDTFGISSGKVRERILELMKATEGLTREQAFNMAVMEQGAEAMGRVGEQGNTMQAGMERMKASVENAKLAIGNSLIPVLTPLIERFSELATQYIPMLVGWITTRLVPAVAQLVKWIQDNLTPALQVAGTWIKEKLLPAIQLLGEWIKTKLIPAIQQVSKWVMTTLVPALMKAYEWFSKYILPVLIAVGDFIAKHVLPVVAELARLFGVVVLTAVKAIAGFWQKVLLPALKKLWTWLDKLLKPLGGIAGAFDKIGQKIRNFTDKLKKLKLPDWLTPGSPTPFEIGLRGIANELSNVDGLMGTGGLNVSAPNIASGGNRMNDVRMVKELKAIRTEINSQTDEMYRINRELLAAYV